MIDLLARLENASKGSSELDGDLAEHLKTCPQEARWIRMLPERHGGTNRNPREWFVQSEDWLPGEKWPDWYAPQYTYSIDAALTLVPENCEWCMPFDNYNPHLYRAEIYTKGEDYEVGLAHTPAIAICVAALRLRNKISVKGDSE